MRESILSRARVLVPVAWHPCPFSGISNESELNAPKLLTKYRQVNNDLDLIGQVACGSKKKGYGSDQALCTWLWEDEETVG